jgi:hypothetical protein
MRRPPLFPWVRSVGVSHPPLSSLISSLFRAYPPGRRQLPPRLDPFQHRRLHSRLFLTRPRSGLIPYPSRHIQPAGRGSLCPLVDRSVFYRRVSVGVDVFFLCFRRVVPLRELISFPLFSQKRLHLRPRLSFLHFAQLNFVQSIQRCVSLVISLQPLFSRCRFPLKTPPRRFPLFAYHSSSQGETLQVLRTVGEASAKEAKHRRSDLVVGAASSRESEVRPIGVQIEDYYR